MSQLVTDADVQMGGVGNEMIPHSVTHHHPSASAPPPTANSIAASSTSTAAAASSSQPKGILKSCLSKKRRPLVWDEQNLDSNEVDRIERGPRMKISEPKTPYQSGYSGQDEHEHTDDMQAAGSPAGSVPAALSLGSRLADISAQALIRREAEWESDEEGDDAAAATSATSAAAGVGAAEADEESDRSMECTQTENATAHTSGQQTAADAVAQAATHSTPHKSHHVHLSATLLQPIAATPSPPLPSTVTAVSRPSLIPDHVSTLDLTTASPASSSSHPDSSVDGSLTPELKHQLFQSKRKGNYHSMGSLLKQKPMQDEDDDE